MGKKVNPTAFRVGVVKDWSSRWFNRKRQPEYLEEDYQLREYIEKKLERAAVESVHITRTGNLISITIHTARPGIVIGRGGKGIEELQKGIKGVLDTISRERGTDNTATVKLDIEEIRKPETYARLVAKNIAEQLERRFPFRRIMKQTIEKVAQEKDVRGVKIALSGRLGGADIARTEHLSRGSIPLQTLRANVDHAHIRANTTYGTIGVQVWIYKGDVFDDEMKK